MPLPPLWALGNQQSRLELLSRYDGWEVVRQYRASDLPLDVLYIGHRLHAGLPGIHLAYEKIPNPAR